MREAKDKPLVAYFADVQGFERAVVAATSAGNARYRIFLALRDVNYGHSFQHIRIRRAHNYDNIVPVLMARRCQYVGIEFADNFAMQKPAQAGANEKE